MFSGPAVAAFASSTRLSPSTRTWSWSRGTPGRSASSVIEDSFSYTSTGGTTKRCCGACSLTAAARWAGEVCTVLLMASPSVHFDAARQGGLALGHGDAQDAVAVVRIHAGGIGVLGQADHAPEASGEA